MIDFINEKVIELFALSVSGSSNLRFAVIDENNEVHDFFTAAAETPRIIREQLVKSCARELDSMGYEYACAHAKRSNTITLLYREK